MPKGTQNANPEILELLKIKVTQSVSFLLSANKNYHLLSAVIFERTGAIVSNSTLRRVFQYDSGINPTKNTLDLICKSIGYQDWTDFVEKDKNHSQFVLSQHIAMFKLHGLGDQVKTRQILEEFSGHPNFFNLLETTAQAAISNRDTGFIRKLFDLKGVFEKELDPIPVFYFIHNLVIGLDKSGLMPELVEYFGANTKVQDYFIEWYVDEDNMNGYFFDLLQVYHRYKTTPEAELFYHCLMYQHALENKLPVIPYLDFIRQFSNTTPVHHIPAGRRLAILMLEANQSDMAISDALDNANNLFRNLNEDDRINTALFMVRLLFIKRKYELMATVLLLAPEIYNTKRNIDDLININQIKIYRAYALFKNGEKANALIKLKEFDLLMVHAFIFNHIMHDFQLITNLLTHK